MEIRKIEDLSNHIRQTIFEAQDDLENTIYYGKSEDGLVKAYVKGSDNIDDIKIDPSLLSAESKEKLEKGIVEAINCAIHSQRLDTQARFMEVMQKLGAKSF